MIEEYQVRDGCFPASQRKNMVFFFGVEVLFRSNHQNVLQVKRTNITKSSSTF